MNKKERKAWKKLKGDNEYTNRYINMLKCGGSKDSLDLLKDVDVNLETTKPVEDAFKYFEEKLQSLEDLLN